MKIYTKVIDGDISKDAQFRLLAEFAAHNGKDISIQVCRGRKRSLSQNAYYWSVVVPMVRNLLNEYGNDVDDEEAHGFLREHVGKLTETVIDGTGRRLAIVKSSTTLSKPEFEEYLLKVRKWAASEGVQIPEPNEHLIAPQE